MKAYLPLFALVLVAALGAFSLILNPLLAVADWPRFFMGFLFCQFSMLKLFNLSQFAKGFQMYDFIGMRWKPYAYSYPFIELILGLFYLSNIAFLFVNIFTVCITSIGAYGVIQALKKGLDVRCACMGNVLNVPLSTVTLSEDLGMGFMALFMLVF